MPKEFGGENTGCLDNKLESVVGYGGAILTPRLPILVSVTLSTTCLRTTSRFEDVYSNSILMVLGYLFILFYLVREGFYLELVESMYEFSGT